MFALSYGTDFVLQAGGVPVQQLKRSLTVATWNMDIGPKGYSLAIVALAVPNAYAGKLFMAGQNVRFLATTSFERGMPMKQLESDPAPRLLE